MQTQADKEYDSDAPYGRKPNGQPYKTKPSMRNAIKNYQDKHRETFRENTKKWTENNKEKHDAYMKEYYNKNRDKHTQYMREYNLNQKLELQYLRELFKQGLQTV